MADNKNNLGTVDVEKMKKALALVDQYYKSAKKISEQTQMQKDAWNGISSSIFGISGADWFEKVPKTTEELAKQRAEIREIDAQLKAAGKTLDIKFQNAFSNVQKAAKDASKSFRDSFKRQSDFISQDFEEINLTPSKKNQESLSKMVKDLKEGAKESKKWDDVFKNIPKELKDSEKLMEKAKKYFEEEVDIKQKGAQELSGDLLFINEIEDENKKMRFLTAIGEGKINELLKEYGYEALDILATSDKINAVIGQDAVAMLAFTEEAEETKKVLSETTKEAANIKKGLIEIGKNLASTLIPKLLEFDAVIHQTQKDTGIMFTQNSAKMTELTVKTAEFGMSVKDTAEFMGAMGEELRTTDFDVLAKAADDLKEVQLATGVSAENLGTIAGEMMRAGHSSADVADTMKFANVQAKKFGVSSKKILDGMAKNITKMRTMGFVGGEKSLAKMVATAERLRMNVDEIFDVAKKARTIEGAMDMAAELQLAGGSFANINPMDLLASARKGPEELQKILTKMGADVGSFNKETGEYEFDPVDVDRLQIVADATGQSLDSIQKMVQKNAEDNKKLEMFPEDMFSVKGLDSDAVKAQISDAIEIGKDGKLTVKEGNIFGASSVDELMKMSKEDIKAKLDEQAANAENLKDQAEENQNFEKAVTALKDSLVNLMGYLEPVVEKLTWVVQGIIKLIKFLGPFGPWIVALIAAFALMPMLTAALGKATFAMNPKNWGAIFKKGGIKQAMMGKTGGAQEDLTKTTGTARETEQIKPKSGTGLKDFLTNLAEGLERFGQKTAKVLRGALALSLTIAMIGASLALVAWLLSQTDPVALLAFGGAIIELAIALKIMSTIGGEIKLKDVAKTALAMGLVGLAMIPFAYAISQFMGAADWGSVLIAVGILALIIIGLMAIGIMLTGPQLIGLLIGAAALALVGLALLGFAASMLLLGQGLKLLSEIDWSVFPTMMVGLLAVSAGLMAFALAGMLFLNPIMLIGMMLMIGTLLAISLVLIPLALALEMGGKGLDTMASGILKLSDTLGKLDFEKLAKVEEFAEKMALASLAGGAITAMVAVIDAIGKISGGGGAGGAGGGGTKTLIVQLKMPNGRILEEHIVKDIDKAS